MEVKDEEVKGGGGGERRAEKKREEEQGGEEEAESRRRGRGERSRWGERIEEDPFPGPFLVRTINGAEMIFKASYIK